MSENMTDSEKFAEMLRKPYVPSENKVEITDAHRRILADLLKPKGSTEKQETGCTQ